ncbi:hypothetical protein EYF80_037297 [Liparis tanakae]|uniref:Uncharacterized protein n=1 Tax=Liparis tanakae TaxID=230148 RepID=A0A4Z2GGV6_9TELE|nr:hypothetical protein EYF80_037297 [Liparis tanakae]
MPGGSRLPGPSPSSPRPRAARTVHRRLYGDRMSPWTRLSKVNQSGISRVPPSILRYWEYESASSPLSSGPGGGVHGQLTSRGSVCLRGVPGVLSVCLRGVPVCRGTDVELNVNRPRAPRSRLSAAPRPPAFRSRT